MPDKHAVVGRQTAIGGTWTIGARLVSRVIDLITMVVLARILHPKDFGLVAIAMTIIYIVEAALELPLSQALVRLPAVEAEHYDTAFTLGLLRGLALGAIVCSVSWPFARFYQDSRILPLVCVLSLAPASRGLVSPRLADFSRNIDFFPDFTMEFIGKLAAFLCAILVGFLTHSYWAIAVGTVVSPLGATLTSYVLAPYRPRLSLSRLSAFSGFLGWITAAQVVSSINWQADRLILGKLTSKSELGLFTAANDTANIPLMAFLSPILRPLLSAFSVLRENPTRLVSSYQSASRAIITIGLPILVGESLIANPGIRLMFGEQWIGSVILLRWLALSIIPTLFAAPLAPLVMSFGSTQIFFKRNLFEICIKLPLVVLGAIKFGFMGIIAARAISEFSTVLYCMFVIRRLLGISLLRQVLAPWRSIVSVSVMAAVTSLFVPELSRISGGVHLAAVTLLTIVLAVVIYLSTLYGLWFAVGSPSGLEAMVAERFSALVKHAPRATAGVA
jgi:PST family polysaccharide transporter